MHLLELMHPNKLLHTKHCAISQVTTTCSSSHSLKEFLAFHIAEHNAGSNQIKENEELEWNQVYGMLASSAATPAGFWVAHVEVCSIWAKYWASG